MGETPNVNEPREPDMRDAPDAIRNPWQIVGWLTVYVASLTALVVGLVKLDEPIALLLGSQTRWHTIVVATAPLLATLLFHGLPTVLAYRRRQRTIREGLTGEPSDPGYFRLAPYQETDRERFSRADGAHESVLRWLLSTHDSILYLTARSGCGKSSLLNAWVLPRLREQTDPWRVVLVRTTFQPLAALRAALLKPGAVFAEPSERTKTLPMGELLAKAAAEVRSEKARLLVVFDQFEECLIEEADAEQRGDLARLLRELAVSPIAGLRLLLAVRSDFIGQLEQFELPALRQDENWKEIGAFTPSAAAKFLRGSDLTIGDGLLERVLHDGSQIDETRGVIRPIVLNMIGRVLEEGAAPQLRRALPKRETAALLVTYIREQVGSADVVRNILRCMITSAGTKRPARTSKEIGVNAGVSEAEARGELLRLSTSGLTRRLDAKADTWEVAHDFVARLVDRYLLGWRPTILRRLRAWGPLAGLGFWAGLATTALMLDSPTARENAAIRRLINLNVNLSDPNGRLMVPSNAISELVNLHSFLSNETVLGIEGPSTQKTKLTDLSPIKYLKILKILRVNTPNVNDITPLAELTHLEIIILSQTAVSDLTPLAGLTQLQKLDLNQTTVSDLTPLQGLTQLRGLWLNQTAVRDLTPLAGLTQLQELDLNQTAVRDLTPLKGLTQLQWLYLSQTDTSDLTPLMGLTQLLELYLDQTPVSDLTPLTGLRQLEKLWLSHTTVRDLTPLKGLTQLRWLHLNETNVSDLTPLKGLTQLRRLNLNQTAVSDLTPLKGLTQLRELHLNDTNASDLTPLAGLTNLDIYEGPPIPGHPKYGVKNEE